MRLVVYLFMASCRPLIISVCTNLLRPHSPEETQLSSYPLPVGWATCYAQFIAEKKVNNGRKTAIGFDSAFSLE